MRGMDSRLGRDRRRTGKIPTRGMMGPRRRDMDREAERRREREARSRSRSRSRRRAESPRRNIHRSPPPPTHRNSHRCEPGDIPPRGGMRRGFRGGSQTRGNPRQVFRRETSPSTPPRRDSGRGNTERGVTRHRGRAARWEGFRHNHESLQFRPRARSRSLIRVRREGDWERERGHERNRGGRLDHQRGIGHERGRDLERRRDHDRGRDRELVRYWESTRGERERNRQWQIEDEVNEDDDGSRKMHQRPVEVEAIAHVPNREALGEMDHDLSDISSPDLGGGEKEQNDGDGSGEPKKKVETPLANESDEESIKMDDNSGNEDKMIQPPNERDQDKILDSSASNQEESVNSQSQSNLGQEVQAEHDHGQHSHLELISSEEDTGRAPSPIWPSGNAGHVIQEEGEKDKTTPNPIMNIQVNPEENCQASLRNVGSPQEQEQLPPKLPEDSVPHAIYEEGDIKIVEEIMSSPERCAEREVQQNESEESGEDERDMEARLQNMKYEVEDSKNKAHDADDEGGIFPGAWDELEILHLDSLGQDQVTSNNNQIDAGQEHVQSSQMEASSTQMEKESVPAAKLDDNSGESVGNEESLQGKDEHDASGSKLNNPAVEKANPTKGEIDDSEKEEEIEDEDLSEDHQPVESTTEIIAAKLRELGVYDFKEESDSDEEDVISAAALTAQDYESVTEGISAMNNPTMLNETPEDIPVCPDHIIEVEIDGTNGSQEVTPGQLEPKRSPTAMMKSDNNNWEDEDSDDEDRLYIHEPYCPKTSPITPVSSSPINSLDERIHKLHKLHNLNGVTMSFPLGPDLPQRYMTQQQVSDCLRDHWEQLHKVTRRPPLEPQNDTTKPPKKRLQSRQGPPEPVVAEQPQPLPMMNNATGSGRLRNLLVAPTSPSRVQFLASVGGQGIGAGQQSPQKVWTDSRSIQLVNSAGQPVLEGDYRILNAAASASPVPNENNPTGPPTKIRLNYGGLVATKDEPGDRNKDGQFVLVQIAPGQVFSLPAPDGYQIQVKDPQRVIYIRTETGTSFDREALQCQRQMGQPSPSRTSIVSRQPAPFKVAISKEGRTCYARCGQLGFPDIGNIMTQERGSVPLLPSQQQGQTPLQLYQGHGPVAKRPRKPSKPSSAQGSAKKQRLQQSPALWQPQQPLRNQQRPEQSVLHRASPGNVAGMIPGSEAFRLPFAAGSNPSTAPGAGISQAFMGGGGCYPIRSSAPVAGTSQSLNLNLNSQSVLGVGACYPIRSPAPVDEHSQAFPGGIGCYPIRSPGPVAGTSQSVMGRGRYNSVRSPTPVAGSSQAFPGGIGCYPIRSPAPVAGPRHAFPGGIGWSPQQPLAPPSGIPYPHYRFQGQPGYPPQRSPGAFLGVPHQRPPAGYSWPPQPSPGPVTRVPPPHSYLGTGSYPAQQSPGPLRPIPRVPTPHPFPGAGNWPPQRLPPPVAAPRPRQMPPAGQVTLSENLERLRRQLWRSYLEKGYF